MSSQVLTVTVTNEFGQTGSAQVTLTEAEAPSIASVSISPAVAVAGTTRTLTVTASDPQGSALVYTLAQADGTDIPLTATATPGVFTFVG